MIPELYLDAVLDLLPDAKGPAWCRLVGNSMAPLICHADLLLVQPGNRHICVGDVIIVKSTPNQCAHRVVWIGFSKGRKVILTKGDNSYSFDRPVNPGRVLAKVMQVKGAHGTLDLNSARWRLRGFLIAVYSYAEGRRNSRDSRFWRFLDTILTWFHSLERMRGVHRQDLYRRIAAIDRNTAAAVANKGGWTDES